MGWRGLGILLGMKRSALWLGLAALAACGEKGQRSGAAGASTSVAPPPESAAATAAVPSTTRATVSIPSPFPADKDTGRFATQLAAGASQVPSCGSTLPRITPDSIGPFRPGKTILELQQRCPRLLFGWVMISDGYPVPNVAARLGGATITAFTSDSLPTARLGQVVVRSSGPRTAEGFGVGSTLQQMTPVYGAPKASESDCVLRVWFDSRPLLAFFMEYPQRERRECGALSVEPLSPNLVAKAVVLTPP